VITSVFTEAVGLAAFATNVWANILLARKAEAGWVVRLVANAFWLAFGIIAFSIANILNSVTFAVINVYALRRWRRERLAVPPTTKCADHYRIDCRYCSNIIRQCRCHIGTDKPITRDGVCGVCVKMLPPTADDATTPFIKESVA
jgi:hypothetical protein